MSRQTLHIADAYNTIKERERQYINSTADIEQLDVESHEARIESFQNQLDLEINAFSELYNISTYEAYNYLDCRFCHGRKEFLKIVEKNLGE